MLHLCVCVCIGKTHAELQHTQTSIEEQLQSGEAADPEFSAAILKRLRIHKAKAKLREIHSDLLQQHLDRTQHVPEDLDVAQEMGWEEEGAQVCRWAGRKQAALKPNVMTWQDTDRYMKQSDVKFSIRFLPVFSKPR